MMRHTFPHIIRFFLVIMTALLLTTASAWALEVVLVAHPDVQVDLLSSRDVQMIFLGKKTVWEDKTPVIPLVQVPSEVTKIFLKDMLDLSPRQYYLYWRKALFTGRGIPPEEVANDQAMIERLLETPGSIGYVSADALDSRVRQVPSR